MLYNSELVFFQSLLKNFHINTTIISPDNYDLMNLDNGLRHFLGMNSEYEKIDYFLNHILQENTIYKAKDTLFCNYIFLLLPCTEITNIFVIGPYTTIEITKHSLMQLAEKYTIPLQIFSALEKHFLSIPYIANDSLLMVALNTLGEKMWGNMNNVNSEIYEFHLTHHPLPLRLNLNHHETENFEIHMQALEKRYSLENQFLEAVSQGLTYKAEQILSQLPTYDMEQRSADPVRNLQNYSIIMNTLLRKAAEKGMIHPLYLDNLSSDIGRRIETLTTREGAYRLQRDMIHKYCLLVKNHSMKGYSLLVQKVIIKIDSDLTADLTLKALALALNVNASYLSHLFKKETGTTLTEYVNKKRVEYSLLLLNSTTLQIQTIAQYCGIPDVNYFTKLFKKYYGKTPSAYRESIWTSGLP